MIANHPILGHNYSYHIRGDRSPLTYAHIHSLCDGVHTCDIVNEWLCSYREVKPIQ